MRVIIIGCDQLGAELANRLSDHHHEVVVVDEKNSAFVRLHRNFRGRVHEGEPLNQDVLTRAGIEEAEAFLALTKEDTTNYVLGLAAREIYHVPHVIVRNSDPDCHQLCEIMGLQVVSSAAWGAEQLEEMINERGVEPVMMMGSGEIEVYNIRIPAEWDGKTVQALVNRKENQVVAAITRAGRSFIPHADMLLEAGDVLHVAADNTGIDDLRRKMQIRLEGGAGCG